MSDVVTSLPVNFSAGNTTGSLSLSMFDSYVGLGWVALKLEDTIPTGTVQLFADVGKVEVYELGSESVSAKIELVTNVDSISAPYGETITFLWAVSESGLVVTPTLVKTGATYKVTPKCSGIIKKSSYVSPFTILRYQPKIKTAGLIAEVQYGVVAAVKESSASILQVAIPPNANENAWEAYRIVSEVLVNDQGEWEKPNGWPSTPTYPGGVTPVPDADAGVIVERVHEIAVITSKVTSSVRRYLVSYAKPFSTNPNYNPAKTLKPGALSSMTKDQRIFASELIADRKRFAL